MANRVGHQLGHYRLLRLLGQGAFAEVYLAEHLYLERPAAIKILHVQMEPEAQEQFRLEARTIAHLQHPHIVPVLDFGLDDQTPYLVMEYTPGGTLREQHPKGTRLPYEQIVSYVKQIASALDYAHEQRVIHRDVKPANLLLNARGEVVLSDFGLAVVQRTLESLSTHEPAGTPLYMAPEQIRHHPCAASDQYALGIMVYQWLCGEPPFDGQLYALLAQHLSELPPSLCERLPTLPRAVEEAVFRTLAKEPEQRFASVRDFASALEEASIAARPYSLYGFSEQPASSVQDSTLSVQVPLSVQPFLSRRVILGALASIGGVSTGIFLWRLFQQPSGIGSPPGTQSSLKARPPLGTTLFVYHGHTSPVEAVKWSPDGSRVASGSHDQTVQIWDALSGKRAAIYRGHENGVVAVAWSPDGSRIASAGYDGTVRIWNVASQAQLLVYREHTNQVHDITWSPDGSRIASASADGTVHIWEVDSGTRLLLYKDHAAFVEAVSWSPDGSRIVSSGFDNTARVWEVASGKTLLIYRKHSGDVGTVAWSPDGSRIASGSHDKTAQIWDATSGHPYLTYSQHADSVRIVAWSSDGKSLASGSFDRTVRVWNPATGETLFTYTKHSDLLVGVAWSPDNEKIASGSYDFTVQVWQAR